jgi:hypothetical protein
VTEIDSPLFKHPTPFGLPPALLLCPSSTHLTVPHHQLLWRSDAEGVLAAQRRVAAAVKQAHVLEGEQVLAAALVAVQVGGSCAKAQPQVVKPSGFHAS